VFRHDNVAARTHGSIAREIEIYSAANPPIREVDGVGAAIVDFDVLVVVRFRNRMIHDFVDDEIALQRRSVGGTRRRDAHLTPVGRTIRITPAWRAAVSAKL